MTHWSCPPEWAGETAYIVAGGPSVADLDLSTLAGRRVIAIKSSWKTVPFADFLIWHDEKWWQKVYTEGADRFAGRIVTTYRVPPEGCLPMKGAAADLGITDTPTELCIRRTTTQAAMNLAAHLGVSRIVILGLDLATRGERNHHHDEPPWDWRGAQFFGDQREDLKATVKPLARRGIEVVNCSPSTATVDWWPKARLEDVL